MLLPPAPEGRIYEYTTSDKRIVKIKEADPTAETPPGMWLVELTGVSPGEANVKVYSRSVDDVERNRPGTVEDSVNVFVYAEREVQVNFIRVIPHPSQIGRSKSPGVQLSHVPEILRKMNALYKYQANLILRAHLNTEAVLDADLDVSTPNPAGGRLPARL